MCETSEIIENEGNAVELVLAHYPEWIKRCYNTLLGSDQQTIVKQVRFLLLQQNENFLILNLEKKSWKHNWKENLFKKVFGMGVRVEKLLWDKRKKLNQIYLVGNTPKWWKTFSLHWKLMRRVLWKITLDEFLFNFSLQNFNQKCVGDPFPCV